MITVSHQKEINREKEIKKKKKTEILKLKNTVAEMKNSLEGFHSRTEKVKK